MGRPAPSKAAAPPPGYRDEPERGDGSSAMSLHSNIGYEDTHNQDDDDFDEALPPYSDDPSGALLPDSSPSTTYPYHAPPPDPGHKVYTNLDRKGTTRTYLSDRLTTDPAALESYILSQSTRELRSEVIVTGTHTTTSIHNTSSSKDKSSKKETVIDFNYTLDLTPTISRRHQGLPCWSQLSVLPNEERTYRGTRVKRRDARLRSRPSASVSTDPETNLEPASLSEWCHRFCASPSRTKTFTLRRHILDRDDALLRAGIEAAVRETGYRGHLDISFPTHERSVTVTTRHWINRARANVYIWWFVVLSQLWVLAWPTLWLLTKRWDVVQVEFPFKKSEAATGRVSYVLCGERDWCSRWGFTVQQAALRKVGSQCGKGNMPVKVTYLDPVQERLESERRARELDQRVSAQTGIWGAAMGALRGGVALAAEWQNGREWGYDD